MSIHSTDEYYIIHGKLTNKTGTKLSHFIVKAIDKDLIEDDHLGSTLTAEDGSFSLRVHKKKYKSFFDRKPDIYFEVYHTQDLLHTTKSKVLKNVEVHPEAIVLDVDFPNHFQAAGMQPSIASALVAKPGYLSSNLSDSAYGYDMVVGTTLKAINATMKHMLYSNSFEAIEMWYATDENGNNPKVMQPIPNLNIFDIESGDSGVPAALLNTDFAYGLKMEFGLPRGVKPEWPLQAVNKVKNQENKWVARYNCFFGTLQIVKLTWGKRGKYSWQNLNQDAATEPWVITFDINLNFGSSDFESLPETAKQRLKNLDTVSAFSVQQLFLDLNTKVFQESMNPFSDKLPNSVSDVLKDTFEQIYWDHLPKEAAILGYSVTKNNEKSEESSIVPTDLRLEFIPHYDEAGKPTNNSQLSTLNYLMMSGNRSFPSGTKPFNWNWVEDTEVNKIDGTMAIKKERFANFLNETLSKNLSSICLIPWTDFHRPSLFSATAAYDIKPNTDPGKFTYKEVSSSAIWGQSDGMVLTLDYKKAHKTTDTLAGSQAGHFEIYTDVTGSVILQDNEIRLTLKGRMIVDLDNGDLEAGNVIGLVGGYNIDIIYILEVDSKGKLTVRVKDGYPKDEKIPSAVRKGIAAGVDHTVDISDALEAYYDKVAGDLKAYTSTLAALLNNSAGDMWIFPGGNTFQFRDPKFSENQDLVVHITYADPSPPTGN